MAEIATLQQQAVAVGLDLAEQGFRQDNGRWKRGSVPEAPDNVGAHITWAQVMRQVGTVLDWRPDLADEIALHDGAVGIETQASGADGDEGGQRERWAPQVAAGDVSCHEPACVMPDRRILPGQPWALSRRPEQRGGWSWSGPCHAACLQQDGSTAGYAGPRRSWSPSQAWLAHTGDMTSIADLGQAREVRPGRAALAVVAAVIFALGWVTVRAPRVAVWLSGVTWLALAWLAVLVREAWREGRKSARPAPAGG